VKGLLLGIAYVCIWSTPIQVGFVLWALGVVFTTDATLLSLSNDAFLREYVPFFHAFLKPFSYAVFPDPFADFIWSLPVALHASFKAITGTLLGLWLLPIAKRMAPKRAAHAGR
jgi:hypothetical protein